MKPFLILALTMLSSSLAWAQEANLIDCTRDNIAKIDDADYSKVESAELAVVANNKTVKLVFQVDCKIDLNESAVIEKIEFKELDTFVLEALRSFEPTVTENITTGIPGFSGRYDDVTAEVAPYVSIPYKSILKSGDIRSGVISIHWSEGTNTDTFHQLGMKGLAIEVGGINSNRDRKILEIKAKDSTVQFNGHPINPNEPIVTQAKGDDLDDLLAAIAHSAAKYVVIDAGVLEEYVTIDSSSVFRVTDDHYKAFVKRTVRLPKKNNMGFFTDEKTIRVDFVRPHTDERGWLLRYFGEKK